MALWIVRAGRHGERESYAQENNVVIIGWDDVPDISKVKSRDELFDLIKNCYPQEKEKTIKNWESQLWAFSNRIKIDDLVALPLKSRSVILFGKVKGSYKFKSDNPTNAKHFRQVEWLGEFPRTLFGQDLLYSLGSAMTVCKITRNNAEERVKNILSGKPDSPLPIPGEPNEGEGEDTSFDVELYARDQIVSFINSKFKGHGLQRVVGAILQAQGYTIKISPEGADGGVDIIAGKGALGLEPPHLAVQVKSSDSPVDVSVLRELKGVMSSFDADLGLIVSWGGYKRSVEKEANQQFFKIRLWDSNDLVSMLQTYYEQLPADIQAELPLKRIWALVPEED